MTDDKTITTTVDALRREHLGRLIEFRDPKTGTPVRTRLAILVIRQYCGRPVVTVTGEDGVFAPLVPADTKVRIHPLGVSS